jgi:hypothetical protein
MLLRECALLCVSCRCTRVLARVSCCSESACPCIVVWRVASPQNVHRGQDKITVCREDLGGGPSGCFTVLGVITWCGLVTRSSGPLLPAWHQRVLRSNCSAFECYGVEGFGQAVLSHTRGSNLHGVDGGRWPRMKTTYLLNFQVVFSVRERKREKLGQVKGISI